MNMLYFIYFIIIIYNTVERLAITFLNKFNFKLYMVKICMINKTESHKLTYDYNISRLQITAGHQSMTVDK